MESRGLRASVGAVIEPKLRAQMKESGSGQPVGHFAYREHRQQGALGGMVLADELLERKGQSMDALWRQNLGARYEVAIGDRSGPRRRACGAPDGA